MLSGIDHVQLAMPAGEEDAARRFYVGVLGFAEEPKPPALAARGGCWFRAGALRVHLGVDADFRPARRAHPAFLVSGLADFVRARDLAVRWERDGSGPDRCYLDDVFGNRIELVDDGSP